MTRRLLVLITMALVLPARPASAGGGGHCIEPLEDRAATQVDLKSNCALPAVARVPAGGTVVFENYDDVAHTVTAVQRGFMGADVAAHQHAEIRFDRAGVFPYACLFHPGMGGAIVVEEAALPVAVQPTAASAAQQDGGSPLLPFALGGLAVLIAGMAWRGATMRR
jgi:plastocyanin